MGPVFHALFAYQAKEGEHDGQVEMAHWREQQALRQSSQRPQIPSGQTQELRSLYQPSPGAEEQENQHDPHQLVVQRPGLQKVLRDEKETRHQARYERIQARGVLRKDS